jgi:hypothetical protein
MNLTEDTQRVYQTLRIFMQAILFCAETPDRKMKKSMDSTLNVTGLVITFDQQLDHIDETNIGANLLKIVQALVKHANNLARRPFNGEASQTFTYKNEFRQGTDFTRTKPHRRYLGQAIAPEDSITYMQRIFKTVTFDEIVSNSDIIEGMYGSMEEGNALVTIARPGFVPQETGNEDRPGEENHHEDLPTFVAEP